MVGPYDLSGSLGVPGQTNHSLVQDAEDRVIAACKRNGKACGTQLAEFTKDNLDLAVSRGYSFLFASSDLFVLNNWATNVSKIITMKEN
jgi:2-dehydro-3-deoxyglucarate aldolase